MNLLTLAQILNLLRDKLNTPLFFPWFPTPSFILPLESKQASQFLEEERK